MQFCKLFAIFKKELTWFPIVIDGMATMAGMLGAATGKMSMTTAMITAAGRWSRTRWLA